MRIPNIDNGNTVPPLIVQNIQYMAHKGNFHKDISKHLSYTVVLLMFFLASLTIMREAGSKYTKSRMACQHPFSWHDRHNNNKNFSARDLFWGHLDLHWAVLHGSCCFFLSAAMYTLHNKMLNVHGRQPVIAILDDTPTQHCHCCAEIAKPEQPAPLLSS